MMTAMIDGQPKRNVPMTVAVPNAPMTRPSVCSAYTTCVVVTSESDGVVMGAGILIGGSGVVGSAQHSAGRGPGHERQLMKPRSRAAKLTTFGRISGISAALTPIQEARVAAYCSTEVVGISRPLPASVGPFDASSG